MTGGMDTPLYLRLEALADAGHSHTVGLRKCAAELRVALASLDAIGNGTMTAVSLRDVLRCQHRARLAYFRATGKQVDMA